MFSESIKINIKKYLRNVLLYEPVNYKIIRLLQINLLCVRLSHMHTIDVLSNNAR